MSVKEDVAVPVRQRMQLSMLGLPLEIWKTPPLKILRTPLKGAAPRQRRRRGVGAHTNFMYTLFYVDDARTHSRARLQVHTHRARETGSGSERADAKCIPFSATGQGRSHIHEHTRANRLSTQSWRLSALSPCSTLSRRSQEKICTAKNAWLENQPRRKNSGAPNPGCGVGTHLVL